MWQTIILFCVKVKVRSSFLLTDHSHGGQEGVEGLLPQDLASDGVLHHPRLELRQLQHLVLVLVAQLEHLSHHLGQVQLQKVVSRK